MNHIVYQLNAGGETEKKVQEYEREVEEAMARRSEVLKGYQTDTTEIIGEDKGDGPVLALGFFHNSPNIPEGWRIMEKFRKFGYKDYESGKVIHFYSPDARTKKGRKERDRLASLKVTEPNHLQSKFGFNIFAFRSGLKIRFMQSARLGKTSYLAVPIGESEFKPEDAKELKMSEWKAIEKQIQQNAKDKD